MDKPVLSLVSPLHAVPDIGKKRAEKLELAGYRTVLDLLYCFPFRYEDRRAAPSIRQLVPGTPAGFLARVRDIRKKNLRNSRVPVIEADLEDGSGGIRAVWFGQEYLLKTLPPGSIGFFFGKPEISAYDGLLNLRSPVVEKMDEEKKGQKSFHVNRIVPVYHESHGLTSSFFRKTIGLVLTSLWGNTFEPLPPSVLSRLEITGWFPAIVGMHFPQTLPVNGDPDSLLLPDYPPRKRFVFEELFFLEFLMGYKKREIRLSSRERIRQIPDDEGVTFAGSLPYALTAAQKRACREIAEDMSRTSPMNRLLLGDVGSGKTVVAAWGVYLSFRAGLQSALMAPTEVLAQQHHVSLKALLEPHGIRTALLTQSVRKSEKRALMEAVHRGEVDFVVGTHALIQDALVFSSLGYIVVDEQHKFGVEQRKNLIQKGENPDVLVMTATPIPRSLALSYFGDLDLSVLDERPPGRQPVKTEIVSKNRLEFFWDECVDPVLGRGEQVFVVYSLIEESQEENIKDATTMHGILSRKWPSVGTGLLTGKMPWEEKASVMEDFRSGKIRLLVSTTVVEVGVDIPGATVMVVENAERFGLAQLHQLRGRIGRGSLPGMCYLIPGADASREATGRLEILVRTEDGFVVAEEDLRLRGPGEFIGTRQSGLPMFQVANLVRDVDILLLAREQASMFLEPSPNDLIEHSWEWTTLMNFVQNRYPGVQEWLMIR